MVQGEHSGSEDSKRDRDVIKGEENTVRGRDGVDRSWRTRRRREEEDERKTWLEILEQTQLEPPKEVLLTLFFSWL